MRKIFFFFILFFLPFGVYASSIKELEVKNGVLSREFESTNNVYSVTLNEDAQSLEIDYKLVDEQALVEVSGNEYQSSGENKAVYKITNSDGTTEEYVFFLEKEETMPVFQESFLTLEPEQKEIPYLSWYVSGSCFLVILIMFKVIVLGFKKKNTRNNTKK